MISTTQFQTVIKSAPVPVRFAGFEGTTLSLQNNGWEISMQQEMHMDALRLAIKHSGCRLYGISRPISFVQQMYSKFGSGSPDAFISTASEMGFDLMHVGSNIQFEIIPHYGPMNFQPIDATPSIEYFDSNKRISIEDLIPFRPIGGDLVHIDPEDVSALLEHIKKVQAPKQDQIRETLEKKKKRMHENLSGYQLSDHLFKPDYENKIQIVSFAA